MVELDAIPWTEPKISVVVVTYNNLDDTRRCVRSLLQLTGPRARIIVVDNGSEDREDDALGTEFGTAISTLRVPENRGYAAGANVGIRAALGQGAGYVWLLNNDTVVRENALAHLVAPLFERSDLGLVSPIILGSEMVDWSEGIWYAGGHLDLAHSSAQHVNEMGESISMPLLPTDFVTGCAMLVRREVFESIGLLDESFYLFWEDVDFSLRACRRGWRIAVVAAPDVHHKVHGTIGRGTYRFLNERNGRTVAGRYANSRQILTLLKFTLRSTRQLLRIALRGNADARDTLRGYCAGSARMFLALARRALQGDFGWRQARPTSEEP